MNSQEDHPSSPLHIKTPTSLTSWREESLGALEKSPLGHRLCRLTGAGAAAGICQAHSGSFEGDGWWSAEAQGRIRATRGYAHKQLCHFSSETHWTPFSSVLEVFELGTLRSIHPSHYWRLESLSLRNHVFPPTVEAATHIRQYIKCARPSLECCLRTYRGIWGSQDIWVFHPFWDVHFSLR